MNITVKDLSADQREAYNKIVGWIGDRARQPLLSLGGYAGCLSGNTNLMYNRGTRNGVRPITLRDLYLKFNGRAVPGVRGAGARFVDLTLPTYLYSLWTDEGDERVELNRIVAVYESGTKPVMRITFDKDRSLVCTAEHPIASRICDDASVDFVPAGELGVGDSVLARATWRTEPGKGRDESKRPPRIIVNTKHHPIGAFKEVECNGITYEYMRVARARLVVEAAMNDLPYDEFVHALKHNAGAAAMFKYLPSTVDVHHRDENTLNDDLDNLQVLPSSEHARLHTAERNRELDRPEQAKILKIEQLGEEMTYDIQMEAPANNFVADGIIVHNSGKSTLVSLVAEEVDLPAFCAYTGKATSVLRRKLKAAGTETVGAQKKSREGMMSSDQRPYCGTIHSLIYRPCDCREPKTVDIVKPCPVKDCGAETIWIPPMGVSPAGSERSECTGKDKHVGMIKSKAAFDALKPVQKFVYVEKVDGRCKLCGGKEWLRREALDRHYGLIIVDEASMVDDMMLRDLQSYGVPILAVGDHGQLPPVGGVGSIMKHPNLRLEQIHRQAEGNPIIALSKIIRETGKFPESMPGDAVRFEKLRFVDRIVEERYENASAARLLEMGLACYTNRRRKGLNDTVRRVRGISREGFDLPVKGEHVVCLRNIKEQGGRPPVANGMRGVLQSDVTWKQIKNYRGEKISESETQIVGSIAFPDDEISAMEYEMFAPQFRREKTYSSSEELAEETGVRSFSMAGNLFDFGYAMTVHKMQGSSFDDLVVCAEKPGPVSHDDWARWAYTAATRAVSRLLVLR